MDVVDITPDPRNSAVDTVDVTFSGPINGGTFTGADITLTRNGGANLIDGGVTVSLVSGNAYRIANLAALTANEGSYTISVSGAGISDANGNGVNGSVSDSWTVDLTPPTVTTASFVGSGTLPSGATSLSVSFSESVVGANSAANYEVRRAGADGLLGTSDDPIISVTSASVSGNTASLSFAALTEDVFRLTVSDAITDTAGNAIDGDADGNAGGASDGRDFVAGALPHTLTALGSSSIPNSAAGVPDNWFGDW